MSLTGTSIHQWSSWRDAASAMHTAVAAHGLHPAHNLCFEAWEGKDVGEEDSEDDAMKSELEKIVWFLLWEKGSIYFLYIRKHFSPRSCGPCTLSVAAFKDCAGLVLLTFSVQEPKAASKGQKHCLHLCSTFYTFFLCTKFLLWLLLPRQTNAFKN